MKTAIRLATAGLTLFCAAAPAVRAHAEPAYALPKPTKTAPELFMAIGHGDLAGVKALLARGVDPNSQNTLGMSALTIAAATPNIEIVKTLLDSGAQLNGGSPFGNPLVFAALTGQSPTMRLLLQKGANVASGRPDKISVLMLAARTGDAEIVKQLLTRKLGVNDTDNNGSTALSYAARSGKTEAAAVLLAAGAKVDAADAEGWTPLMHAAVNGHAATAKLLLERGASPKLKDRQGRTALVLAASYGDHPVVVQALVARGAELEAKDLKGRTARSLAEARGFTATAKVLGAKGARPVSVLRPARSIRDAAQAGLKQIEHANQIFAKRTGCASCHHEGIARFATGFAQARGYAINAAIAKDGEKRVIGQFDALLPLMKRAVENPEETKNVPIVDVGDLAPTTGTLMLGLSEHGTAPTESLGAAAVVLARTQTPDGDWRFGLMRTPVQSSFFTSTAMAVRALKTYAPKQYAAEIDGRVDRAKQWFLTAAVRDTEDRAFRLLGLKWAGATTEERQKALEELRAQQRPDGGWGQQAGDASDAYATGLALFALGQGGELSPKDAVYRRGIAYLLRTQDDDGTWYVSKRAIPANNYFNAEFPHGQSQYISHVAACWATLALIQADDTVQRGRLTAR